MEIDWESGEIRELLERRNDGELSRQLGVSRQRVQQVRKKLGIASHTSRRRQEIVDSGLLGKISDQELATTLVENSKYVSAVRQKLKIAPVKTSKFDEYEHLLGKVSDNKIAKMAGTSQSSISSYRRRRNISPYRARTVVKASDS